MKKAKLKLKIIQQVYKYFGMISDIYICLCPVFGCLDKKTKLNKYLSFFKDQVNSL